MKRVKFGNVLDLFGESIDREHIIAHGCNAKGVMGSGIAKEVKERHPEVFLKYKEYLDSFYAFNRRADSTASPLGHIIPVKVVEGLTIVNAITQDNFGRTGDRYVSYKAVGKAFQQIANMARMSGSDVHFPLIGAGLGGGDWAIISDIIDAAFDPYPGVTRTLWIYE